MQEEGFHDTNKETREEEPSNEKEHEIEELKKKLAALESEKNSYIEQQRAMEAQRQREAVMQQQRAMEAQRQREAAMQQQRMAGQSSQGGQKPQKPIERTTIDRSRFK